MTGKSGLGGGSYNDYASFDNDSQQSPNGLRGGPGGKGRAKKGAVANADQYDADGNWVGPNAKRGGKPMNKRGPNGEYLQLDEHGNYIDVEADKGRDRSSCLGK